MENEIMEVFFFSVHTLKLFCLASRLLDEASSWCTQQWRGQPQQRKVPEVPFTYTLASTLACLPPSLLTHPLHSLSTCQPLPLPCGCHRWLMGGERGALGCPSKSVALGNHLGLPLWECQPYREKEKAQSALQGHEPQVTSSCWQCKGDALVFGQNTLWLLPQYQYIDPMMLHDDVPIRSLQKWCRHITEISAGPPSLFQ